MILLGRAGAGCAKMGRVAMLVFTIDVGGEVDEVVRATAAEINWPTVAGTTTLPLVGKRSLVRIAYQKYKLNTYIRDY